MQKLIYQTIPEQHIRAFIEEGHYFAPCCAFEDKLEFRYGYCLFNYDFSSASDLAKCVGYTNENGELNSWINSTGVSCWVRELYDEPKMWEVHGAGGAAIRVSMKDDLLVRHVELQNHATASGAVIYGGMRSSVRPQFSGHLQLGEAEHAIRHLFFHKRLEYEWEREFRVVLFSKGGLFIKLAPEIIDSVEISPLGKLDSSLERRLRDMFGSRLVGSAGDRKSLTLQRRAPIIDEDTASPSVIRLNKKLAKLETQSRASGVHWNDPKISDAQMKVSIQLEKQMRDIQEQLKQATSEQSHRIP